MDVHSQIIGWMMLNDDRWNIICGGSYGVDDACRREILLKLVEDFMYVLALVLLKTHGAEQSAERAVMRATADFADEPFLQAFLTNVAHYLCADA